MDKVGTTQRNAWSPKESELFPTKITTFSWNSGSATSRNEYQSHDMTTWHPQADGQSQRTNQTVEIPLRFFADLISVRGSASGRDENIGIDRENLSIRQKAIVVD
jgi:hypothetical protein